MGTQEDGCDGKFMIMASDDAVDSGEQFLEFYKTCDGDDNDDEEEEEEEEEGEEEEEEEEEAEGMKEMKEMRMKRKMRTTSSLFRSESSQPPTAITMTEITMTEMIFLPHHEFNLIILLRSSR